MPLYTIITEIPWLKKITDRLLTKTLLVKKPTTPNNQERVQLIKLMIKHFSLPGQIGYIMATERENYLLFISVMVYTHSTFNHGFF